MHIEINHQSFDLKYLILDYNGTLACGGKLLDLRSFFKELSKVFKIFILTGNTFSNLKDDQVLENIEIVITADSQAKKQFVESLGGKNCLAIGNGNIDVLMFEASALSIAVLGCEGCSTKALLQSDLITNSIEDALSILLEPKKLIATLRR
jgi:soluble P-type ATPase